MAMLEVTGVAIIIPDYGRPTAMVDLLEGAKVDAYFLHSIIGSGGGSEP
jgi:hypothetical protein